MTEKRIKFKEKLAYGFGIFGVGFTNCLVLGYLTFYATDVLYIKASIIGIIIFLPKLLDVFTDILITNVVDKTNTRFGKYKPWILAGIPLSCCLYLIFSKPAFLTTSTQQLLWIAAIYFVMSPVFETMYWCPYMTLGTVISADENDRVDLASMRSVFEELCTLISVALCLPLVSIFGEDYHDPVGWRMVALIFAILGIIFTLVCFFGVKERVKVNNCNENGQTLTLKEKLGALKHNTPLIKVLIMQVLLYLPWYAYNTIFNYFCIYVLGHADWVASLSVIGICVAVVASIFASKLSHKLGGHKVIAIGTILTVMSTLVFVFAKTYLSMVFFFIVKDCGLLLIYISLLAYIPRISEYTKKKTGLDVTGIINAVFSTFDKLASSFATYLATLILVISKYDATLSVQTIFTKGVLRYSVVILFLIFAIIIFLINLTLHEFD